jgi:hypothetical protein
VASVAAAARECEILVASLIVLAEPRRSDPGLLAALRDASETIMVVREGGSVAGILAGARLSQALGPAFRAMRALRHRRGIAYAAGETAAPWDVFNAPWQGNKPRLLVHPCGLNSPPSLL